MKFCAEPSQSFPDFSCVPLFMLAQQTMFDQCPERFVIFFLNPGWLFEFRIMANSTSIEIEYLQYRD